MIPLPSLPRALVFTLTAGFGLLSCGPFVPCLARAGAQTVSDPAPVVPDHPAGGMAQTDASGRHLAPHDTFYLLSYVSVKTDKGVEGFEPGQEVRLVEVHYPTRTLVVTDGRAQVEVSPSKLTNDMDIAALVRQKDQASQARIATHVQAQEEAYRKYEQQAADSTAKDLERHQQELVAEARADAQAQATPAAPSANASFGGGNGYYENGGDGYGSPFGYFIGGGGTRGARNGANSGRGAGTAGRAGNTSGGSGTLPAATGTARATTTGGGGRP